jgi:predicted Zn-dependent protease
VSAEVDNDLRRADALIDVNRHRDALPILSSVIAAHPQNATAYCLLARCYSLDGRYDAMLTAASSAVSYAPESEWGFRL